MRMVRSSPSDHNLARPAGLFGELADRLPTAWHLKVHACYHLVVPQHWEIRERRNADYHIIYIKGGEGVYQVGGHGADDGEAAVIPFEKGKVIVVSSGMLHSACQNAGRPPYIIPVRFGIYDNGTAAPIDDAHRRPFSLSFVPKQGREFQQLFERLHACHSSNRPYSEALCGMILGEILIRCCVELADSGAASAWDDRVERVKRMMDEAPYARYEASRLAGLANLSEKYFRRLFTRQYGLTPLAYQTKARMEYAQFLLTDGDQSVSEVALSLGYPDPYSFSKQFKQWIGHPPAYCRERAKLEDRR